MAADVYRLQVAEGSWNLFATDRSYYKRIWFDGKPIRKEWPNPQFYIGNPLSDASDFFYAQYGGGALAFSERVRESEMGEYFERAGEILPATIEGRPGEIYFLNVTACYPCLDVPRSELVYSSNKSVVTQILKHSFIEDRIRSSDVFKIPEDIRSSVFYAHRKGGLSSKKTPAAGSELQGIYANCAFTGLKFELVWSSGASQGE